MQMGEALDIIQKTLNVSRDFARVVESKFAFYPTQDDVTERQVIKEAKQRYAEWIAIHES